VQASRQSEIKEREIKKTTKEEDEERDIYCGEERSLGGYSTWFERRKDLGQKGHG